MFYSIAVVYPTFRKIFIISTFNFSHWIAFELLRRSNELFYPDITKSFWVEVVVSRGDWCTRHLQSNFRFCWSKNPIRILLLIQHKTPSGAFDPEVFAAPSTSDAQQVLQNIWLILPLTVEQRCLKFNKKSVEKRKPNKIKIIYLTDTKTKLFLSKKSNRIKGLKSINQKKFD